jgi:hypothetical protein
MKNKLTIAAITTVFILSTFPALADSKTTGNGSCDGGSCAVIISAKGRPGGSDNSGKNAKASLFYKTKEGHLYLWHHSYNRRLRSYEENGDGESLSRYLYELANRYRLTNKSDTEDFVEWALRKRPWNEE